MVTALVVLLVVLVGIWLVLGFFCTLAIIGKMADGNGQTLILILIFTHFAGLGFIMAGGLIWAAWLMVSAPFKLMAALFEPKPVLAPRVWCNKCQRDDCGHDPAEKVAPVAPSPPTGTSEAVCAAVVERSAEEDDENVYPGSIEYIDPAFWLRISDPWDAGDQDWLGSVGIETPEEGPEPLAE